MIQGTVNCITFRDLRLGKEILNCDLRLGSGVAHCDLRLGNCDLRLGRKNKAHYVSYVVGS